MRLFFDSGGKKIINCKLSNGKCKLIPSVALVRDKILKLVSRALGGHGLVQWQHSRLPPLSLVLQTPDPMWESW